MKEPTRKRRALCLRIAEQLGDHFSLYHRSFSSFWDVDEAANLIDCLLPLSYEEAEAEWEATNEEATSSPGPSLFGRLQDALGINERIGIRATIEAAIEKLKEVG